MLHPLAPPFFHLFQTLLLFGREILPDLAVSFVDYVSDIFSGVPTDLFNLRAGLVDDGTDFTHLLIGQSELPS